MTPLLLSMFWLKRRSQEPVSEPAVDTATETATSSNGKSNGKAKGQAKAVTKGATKAPSPKSKSRPEGLRLWGGRLKVGSACLSMRICNTHAILSLPPAVNSAWNSGPQ